MPKHLAKSTIRSNKNTLTNAILKALSLAIYGGGMCGTGIYSVSAVATQPEEQNTAHPAPQTQGWVNKSELPEELRSHIRPGCSGLYVDPASLQQQKLEQSPWQPSDNTANKNSPIIVESDRAKIVDGQDAQLSGKVTVQQGDTYLVAEEMQLDRQSSQAKMTGGVKIHQPGVLILGESANVDFENNTSEFKNASFVLNENHIRGSAESIKQLSKNKIALENGSVTSCEPDNNGWSLEADTIVVNNETQQGSGKNVKLKVGSVPVLYVPYISFPIGEERKSGFLFPSVNLGLDEGGIDIALPYYWNMAPNYDSTITPRLISDRGFMLDTEARHLNQWAETKVGAAILFNDDGSDDRDLDELIENGDITEEQANPNKDRNRWLISLHQNAGGTQGWYMRNQYTKVSDVDYFRDLGSPSFSSSNNAQLDQIFQVGHRSAHWDIGALTEDHQLLLRDIDSEYEKLPQIYANGRYRWNSLETSLSHEFTHFQRQEEREGIEGQRLNIDYRVAWNKQKQWGFLKPEIGFKSLNYNLSASDSRLDPSEDLNGKDQQHYDALQFSIDSGLKFENTSGMFHQILEPRVYYLYRENVDQSELFNVLGTQDVNFDTFYRTFSYEQLFRDSRYIGADRLDDANQVTLGLSSSWLDHHSGEELLKISMGQILYLEDREVTLIEGEAEQTRNNSELALEAALRLSDNAEFILNTIYDSSDNQTDRSTARIHYADPSRSKIFNAAYSRAKSGLTSGNTLETLEQIDLSTAIQITKQWSIMAKTNYDMHNDQELESFLGFEYDDCCYRFRLLARKWLDSNIASFTEDESAQFDRGIFLEIHLKGLGGSGAKVQSILNDGIWGYHMREQHRP